MVPYMKCTTSVLGKLRTLSPELCTYDPDTQTNTQGRIQDLSEGGNRFISEQKSRFRNKKKRKDRYFSCFAQVFFPLSAIKKLF